MSPSPAPSLNGAKGGVGTLGKCECLRNSFSTVSGG